MKKLKLLSLLVVFGFFSTILPAKLLAQTTDPSSDPTIAAELSADEVTADDLGVSEDEVKLPGTFGHWWNNFKINTRSAFTTDEVKKTELKLKQANLELLAAKKLANVANTDKIKDQLDKALVNYQNRLAKLEEKLKNVPEDKKQTILEKLDEQQLKHQEIFNRLRESAPDKIKERLSEVQKEQIKKWYENHKEDLSKRLQKAVENNNNGSKFKNLQNLGTLKEMSASLPEEARAKLEEAMATAQERLKERIQNLNAEEKDKLEKYLKSLPTDDIKKTEIINSLQANGDLSGLQSRLEKIKAEQLEKIKNQVENLDESAKEKFLKEYFDDEANVTRLQILEKLKNDIPSLKIKVQALDEKQIQMLKEKIQNAGNQKELEKLKKELENANKPILRKEIQDQSSKLKPDDNSLKIKIEDENGVEIEDESSDDSEKSTDRELETKRRGKDIPQVRPLNSSSIN